jgi:hypothetical protein
MSSRHLRRFVFAALCLAACKAPSSQPAAPTSTTLPVVVAPPLVTGEIGASAEPAAAGESTAFVPASLGQLPVGAAIYASVRTGAIDSVLDQIPDAEHVRVAITAKLGDRGRISDVLAKLGVSSERPVLIAALPADAVKARQVIDLMMAGKTPPARGSEPALASAFRIVVPLSGDAGASFDQNVVRELLDAKQLERCPGAEVCQKVGGADLAGILRGSELAAAIHIRPGVAEIDLVRPLLVDTAHASTLLALRTLSAVRLGGPEAPRCARLDTTALASLCIDADRMAELGAASGYGLTVAAVAGANLSRDMRRKIAEQGRTEAGRNLELAAPKRRLLDDGTLTLWSMGKELRAKASWALTPASQAGIEAAFPAEVCVDGSAVGSQLLPKLRSAFGDPGPDFANPEERLRHIWEAGWAAYPILVARTWPSFLPAVLTKLGPSAPELARAGRTCARVKQGRLELESSAGLLWARESH